MNYLRQLFHRLRWRLDDGSDCLKRRLKQHRGYRNRTADRWYTKRFGYRGD